MNALTNAAPETVRERGRIYSDWIKGVQDLIGIIAPTLRGSECL